MTWLKRLAFWSSDYKAGWVRYCPSSNTRLALRQQAKFLCHGLDRGTHLLERGRMRDLIYRAWQNVNLGPYCRPAEPGEPGEAGADRLPNCNHFAVVLYSEVIKLAVREGFDFMPGVWLGAYDRKESGVNHLAVFVRYADKSIQVVSAQDNSPAYYDVQDEIGKPHWTFGP